jgi:hypothetical protein
MPKLPHGAQSGPEQFAVSRDFRCFSDHRGGTLPPQIPVSAEDFVAYNPINLPRISFMIDEHGTGGHAGSSEGKDSPQMSLFEGGKMIGRYRAWSG